MNDASQNGAIQQASRLRHVIVGTAGHIDHGKTRLIGRLTGIMTDRLPEEKSRGISIDLGFAHWEADGFQFGVVDVPGHERFVKNMVAGATGVNLALLVVAADDGVMPQTREHLDIMDLLGIPAGVVVITKIDLVEPDFVELVQAEVEELTAGTFLEGCPVVPVSSETGEGIEQLRNTLSEVAQTLEDEQSRDVFRLPIDRVFSLPGHGTIVTGSVLSGEVQAGDTLELLPEGREVRVRSVQSHGEGVKEGTARRRTAINLAGLKTEELHRGMELATPGFLRPTKRLVVELRNLSGSSVVLKDRFPVNLHLGTAEIPARVILKGTVLKPGETGFAELRTAEPAVAAYGQRFILRRVSPAMTIAGGRVLDPFVPPLKRIRHLQQYGAAAAGEERERLSFLLSLEDDAGLSDLTVLLRAGIPRQRYPELLKDLREKEEVIPLGRGDRIHWIHRQRLEQISAAVLRAIHRELEKHQPRRALPRNTLLTAVRNITRPDVLEAVFEHLLQTKRLVKVGPNVGPADLQVQLTRKQRETREKLLTLITEGGRMPPNIKELSAALKQDGTDIATLLNLSVEDGLLVRVDETLHYSPEALESARQICESYLRDHPEATMSQLREAWGISRKYSVPLCEFFDSAGITVRKGDVRVAGPNIHRPLTEIPSPLRQSSPSHS